MTETFNQPWMSRIHPPLLIRYWRRKGCPGILETESFGLKLRHQRTIWGEFCWIEHPLLRDMHGPADEPAVWEGADD